MRKGTRYTLASTKSPYFYSAFEPGGMLISLHELERRSVLMTGNVIGLRVGYGKGPCPQRRVGRVLPAHKLSIILTHFQVENIQKRKLILMRCVDLRELDFG